MGALNKDETKDLDTVERLLDHIKKHGYRPEQTGDPNQEQLGKAIDLARRRVHTIKTMKGYYPKS